MAPKPQKSQTALRFTTNTQVSATTGADFGLNDDGIPVSTITLPFLVAGRREHIPCLIVAGNILAEPTAYLANLAAKRASPSKLEAYALALRRFSEYFWHRGDNLSSDQLLIEFYETLVTGDSNLGWNRVNIKTADRIFNRLNKYCDWLAYQPGAVVSRHPNPVKEVTASAYELESSRAQHEKTNMLVHLWAQTKAGRGIKTARAIDPREHLAKMYRGGQNSNSLPRARIHFDDFLRLLCAEENPRNTLLWLLLGAGAMRVSEALNLFACDVFFDTLYSEALIAIAHPLTGMVVGPDGSERDRTSVLRDDYGLSPRCLLPKSQTLHAGWKGIDEGSFDVGSNAELSAWSKRRWKPVEWLLPVFGRKFWITHTHYIESRSRLRPKHPYYFVNTKRNIGAPLTRGAVSQILATSCRNAGIRTVGPHALRHMFGTTTTEWGLAPEVRQRLMRHVSPESTAVYSRPTTKFIREMLQQCERRRRQLEIEMPLRKQLIGPNL